MPKIIIPAHGTLPLSSSMSVFRGQRKYVNSEAHCMVGQQLFNCRIFCIHKYSILSGGLASCKISPGQITVVQASEGPQVGS